MSASNTFENEILLLIFNNTNIALIGDATGLRGSSTAGSLYVALHTADPGEAGTQDTNEATYTNYARVAIARTSGGFTVSGDTVTNAAVVTFPQSGGVTNTITHFSFGVASSGTTKIILSGALSDSLIVNNLIAPTFAIGSLSATAA